MFPLQQFPAAFVLILDFLVFVQACFSLLGHGALWEK